MKDIKDFQAIVELTLQALRWNCLIPTIKITPVCRGRYYRRTHRITLPTWLLSQSEQYQIYYCVHETCHIKGYGHGYEFKEFERKALAFWNMDIVYKKAYPKYLYENGQECYQSIP